MANLLYVHNEIGRLQRVLVHRPGRELLNLMPRDLNRLLFDDIPFLEVAREEHDQFVELLRAEGAQVVYLEDLCAEALDAAGSRGEFTDAWLDESGLKGGRVRAAVHEYLDALPTTRALVDRCIAGLRKNELDLSGHAGTTLASIVGYDRDTETDLLIEPMPNAYFTRDPFAVVGRGVALNHMYSKTRRRETLLGRFVFRDHPDYRDAPLWYRRDATYHMEGGDILNLGPRTLAIGISQRTEAAAIDDLAQHMLWALAEHCEIEAIYAFNIPVSRAFMHLDTVFTQIDVDKFTVHPAILGNLQVFRLTRGVRRGEVRIEEMNDHLERVLAHALGLDCVTLIRCGGGDPVAAAREQWNDGSNTLAVAPGRICVYQRNTVTNEALYRGGLELIEVPSAELSRGRGGPRCMSMPLARADV